VDVETILNPPQIEVQWPSSGISEPIPDESALWAGIKAGVSTFFSSAGMMAYDFANHATLGSLDSERYNDQVNAQGERLYNVAKNLGYSDESIAKGYGLAQALAGEVVGTNVLAEAGTGYDLGANAMLDGWERAQKAAVGTSQVAFTSAGVLKITGVNPKLTSTKFPSNPQQFNPTGLVRHEYNNGKIIKWINPKTNKALYEWNADEKGGHYHITPDGKHRIPHPDTNDTHIKPGTVIPHP
jgi:hypothetical protein